MLTMTHVYYVIGATLVGAVVLNLRDRRVLQAAFWAILAVPCLVGDQILAASKAGTTWPAQVMGAGVIALALLAWRIRARKVVDDPEQARAREASAVRFGNWLFVPALAIPGITLVLVLGARIDPRITAWIDPKQLPLIALGLAATLATGLGIALTRARPVHGLTEGRRLLDSIGWPLALPLLLATLGGVFVESGVGAAVSALVGEVIPIDSAAACLLAFGLGMVAFTAIMGNAFAAFPVMMAGIGLPLLVKLHGAQPAALGAMGMLTGYCGTLVTPMAANFNVVPVLLLELRDPHAVIRAQWPTALALLVANLILMSVLVFR
ncbi:MAG TPA: DUF979 family protein [Kofleriaceae bacterium]|jgi:uncharacterized membrane protein|nr:DUF979 family protein [Kofleriaceae bacterium]